MQNKGKTKCKCSQHKTERCGKLEGVREREVDIYMHGGDADLRVMLERGDGAYLVANSRGLRNRSSLNAHSPLHRPVDRPCLRDVYCTI